MLKKEIITTCPWPVLSLLGTTGTLIHPLCISKSHSFLELLHPTCNTLTCASPSRLEQDVKRLKADLQASRQLESELRSQLSSLSSQDRSLRSELGQLRQDNELLQNK